MKNFFLKLTLAVCAFAATAAAAQQPAAPAQNPALTQNRVLGDIVEIDAAQKIAVVSVERAGNVGISLADNTQYFRAKPEALQRAESGQITPADLDKITLADLSVGDRVIVMGRVSDDRKAATARIVIVAKKADIAQKQALDRAEWNRRGALGVVTATNAATKEITISTRTREGMKPLVIEAGGEKVNFLRYPPGSVKYADAKPAAFADVRVGDQLRALGDRSADGARLTPEIVAFGTFRTILGKIKSVDAATRQLQITNEQTKQTFTVELAPDSSVRRMNEMMGMMFARLAGGGAGGARFGGPGGGGPGGGAQPPAGGQPGGGPGGERRMMGGGPGGGGGFDIQEMIERLPQAQLAELKPGDVVIVSSTAGADPARLTAITILAGAEPVLAALQSTGRPGGGAAMGTSSGLPAGLELGIGIP
jgi:hypothetical protein